jgi:hypothetical protein
MGFLDVEFRAIAGNRGEKAGISADRLALYRLDAHTLAINDSVKFYRKNPLTVLWPQ